MIREEYLRRLVDDAHVDVYLSANDGHRIYWPWRMQPPHESSRQYRNACERYIIDSAPQRPATGNRDDLVAAVHDWPELIDAIDYSTPIQSVQDGTIDAGDERMSVAAARAGARLVEDLRRFSPHLSDPPEPPRTTQAGLGDVV